MGWGWENAADLSPEMKKKVDAASLAMRPGWTQAEWDARRGQNWQTKAFTTDDQFHEQWGKGLAPSGGLLSVNEWSSDPVRQKEKDEAEASALTLANDPVAPLLKAAGEAARRRLITGGGGYGSTFKTGAQGFMGQAPIAKPSLLGG